MLSPPKPRWRLVTNFRSIREPLVALTIGVFTSWFAVSGSVAYDNAGTVFCKWPYAGGSSLLYVLHQNDPSYPPTGAYATAFSDARSNWINTATPVYFQPTTYWLDQHYWSALPLTGSGPLGHTDFGCTWPGNQRSWTLVELNTDRLDSESSTVKRSVASHELGHHIGIRHSSVSQAVMNQDRNRESIYSPQTDDICGVNHRYPSTSWPPTCGY